MFLGSPPCKNKGEMLWANYESVRTQRKDRWGEVPETCLEGIRADNQAILFS